MKAGLLLLLLFLLAHPVWGERADIGSVRGRICYEGAEAYAGHAALWEASGGAPDPRRFVTAPQVTVPLERDGSFILQAAPGRYYLGAVLRLAAPLRPGPPQPGDVVFMTPDAAGEALLVDIAAGETADIGPQRSGWVYPGFSDEAGPRIAGRLLDEDGRPVADLLVAAFANPEMSGRAVAISGRTDPQGRFLLRMGAPGTVWLRVLPDYGGGRPVEGGYLGVYGGAEPAPLEVGPEESGAIEIRVRRIHFPSARKGEGTPAETDRAAAGPSPIRQKLKARGSKEVE